jgi:peptidoglycan hydrolase-like protein with peptidoglycan-binding domain
MKKLLISALFCGILVSVSPGDALALSCALSYPTIGTLSTTLTRDSYTEIELNNVGFFSTEGIASDVTINLDVYSSIAKSFGQNGFRLPAHLLRPNAPVPTVESYPYMRKVSLSNAALDAMSFEIGDIVVAGPPGSGPCGGNGFVGIFSQSGTLKVASVSDSGFHDLAFGQSSLIVDKGPDVSCVSNTCTTKTLYTLDTSAQFALAPGESRATGGKIVSISQIGGSRTANPDRDIWGIGAPFTQYVLKFQNDGTIVPPPPPTQPPTTSCPAFSTSGVALYRGSRGTSVYGLQEYLRTKGFLTVEPTGYFGVMTELAVKNWQTASDIVSSGSPATTGWGILGRRSAEHVRRSCGVTPTPTPIPPVQPSQVQFEILSPYAGQSFRYQESYAVEWRMSIQERYSLALEVVAQDGTVVATHAISGSALNGTTKENMSYTNYDTVNEVLRRGITTFYIRARLTTASGHMIKKESGRFTMTGEHVTSLNRFKIAPASGSAPLSVTATLSTFHPDCHSYSIDWGDGSPKTIQRKPMPSVCYLDFTEWKVTHTYGSSGSYRIIYKSNESDHLKDLDTVVSYESEQVTVY